MGFLLPSEDFSEWLFSGFSDNTSDSFSLSLSTPKWVEFQAIYLRFPSIASDSFVQDRKTNPSHLGRSLGFVPVLMSSSRKHCSPQDQVCLLFQVAEVQISPRIRSTSEHTCTHTNIHTHSFSFFLWVLTSPLVLLRWWYQLFCKPSGHIHLADFVPLGIEDVQRIGGGEVSEAVWLAWTSLLVSKGRAPEIL